MNNYIDYVSNKKTKRRQRFRNRHNLPIKKGDGHSDRSLSYLSSKSMRKRTKILLNKVTKNNLIPEECQELL